MNYSIEIDSCLEEYDLETLDELITCIKSELWIALNNKDIKSKYLFINLDKAKTTRDIINKHINSSFQSS